MNEYSKGEWKVITNGNILLAIASCHKDVTKNRNICTFEPLFLRGEKSNIYRQLGGEDEANARLITTAVNACIKVNPENPTAVAEAISDLCEACKAQHDAIDLLFARLILLDKTFYPSESGQPWEAIAKGNEAIAKVESK